MIDKESHIGWKQRKSLARLEETYIPLDQTRVSNGDQRKVCDFRRSKKGKFFVVKNKFFKNLTLSGQHAKIVVNLHLAFLSSMIDSFSVYNHNWLKFATFLQILIVEDVVVVDQRGVVLDIEQSLEAR